MAQAPPEGGLLRLPPKLRRKSPKPIPGNSAGKSASSQTCSISPSLSPRQCPDRYAFRAESELYRQGIRYLRTVIVTRRRSPGLRSPAPCHQVTNFLDLPGTGPAVRPIHGLTTLRRPVFLVTVDRALVTATPFVRRHPFSRSYGAILPSSLERVVSRP
ncbi:hypothetical protein Ddye_032623 [Dipteronia dyeriana]|uniref:Uncharacterized protein n=1 Tax=Dipteronia dyeriana TaxID=168575 RepID=A0AAD9WJI8_9ROSI|nr:hypothetical protein Ddye_032623 [Dipteronia dyeriana]